MLTPKKLILGLLLCMGLLTPALSQQTNENVTAEDYERLIENTFQVDFRALAIKSLDLTTEETKAFTPIYMDYMNAKSELMEKRSNLIAEHRDEMSENNSAASEADEVADFIENYWETDIAEMELRKDYFDKLEDVIPNQKALKFFLLEDAVRKRLQRMELVEVMPVLLEVQLPELDATQGVSAYNQWMINIKGNVSLDHQYTHQGLTKLVNAAQQLVQAEKLTIADWMTKKQNILQLADKLTQDPKAVSHANTTRDAFVMTADLFQSIQQQANFAGTQPLVDNLKTAARQIQPSVQLTNQSAKVRSFFETAERLVNTMAERAELSMSDSNRW